MSLRSDHTVGRSFSKRGRTPVIAVTGKRFGWTMVSAITNRGSRYLMVFKTRFTSAVCVQFVGRLCRQVRHPIFLIVDSHPVHRSAAVQAEVAQQSGKLSLHFLPATVQD